MRKSCIEIVFKTDKTIIDIDETAEYKTIVNVLERKMIELKKIYKNKDLPIQITGKVFNNKEIDEIQKLINDFLDVKVEFETPKSLGLHGIKKLYSKEINTSETKFHKGSLRSGQKIEFEGSMVILGDVNGGAEVVASENVVILGTLRGVAHAGANGNTNAIIAANKIEAPQIRIANKILEIERRGINERINKSIAYINENGKIVLE